jgi:hypothetical protein
MVFVRLVCGTLLQIGTLHVVDKNYTAKEKV